MGKYLPLIGWTMSYPFDRGTMQNSADRNVGYLGIGSGDWVCLKQIGPLEDSKVRGMLDRLGLHAPGNKTGVVVNVSDDRVVALYHHDGAAELIAYSQRNLVRLFPQRPFMKDDIADQRLSIWSWRTEAEASKVARAAAAMLNLPSEPAVAASAESTHPRFHGPGSQERVFVPRLEIRGSGGWLVLNRLGEPVGIRNGDKLTRVERPWMFDPGRAVAEMGV